MSGAREVPNELYRIVIDVQESDRMKIRPFSAKYIPAYYMYASTLISSLKHIKNACFGLGDNTTSFRKKKDGLCAFYLRAGTQSFSRVRFQNEFERCIQLNWIESVFCTVL